MNGAVSWQQVGAAQVLVAAAALVSRWQSLDLEKEMGIASLRAFVQLVAIGYALEFIFATNNAFFVVSLISLMVTVAGFTSGKRATGVPGAIGLALAAIGGGTLATLGSLVALRIFPFSAHTLIPIAGMVIGNAMNVNSLVAARVRDELQGWRPQIEAALSLGAPWPVAVRPYLKRALKAGMIPIIDSTRTVGLIQLPGAMTGMILAGASPLAAVQLQMVVMYMLVGAAAITGLAAAWLCSRAFFSDQHQLLLPERLQTAQGKL